MIRVCNIACVSTDTQEGESQAVYNICPDGKLQPKSPIDNWQVAVWRHCLTLNNVKARVAPQDLPRITRGLVPNGLQDLRYGFPTWDGIRR